MQKSLHGITYVTLGNLIATILGATFWLVIASIMKEEVYGMISYYLGIALILNGVALLGQPFTITTLISR